MKTGIYTVKKGDHKFKGQGTHINFFKGAINFNIVLNFDNSCMYEPSELPHSGVNKLFGFTRICHHEDFLGKLPYIKKYINSWLIGWQVKKYDDRFRIGLYRYFDCLGVETIDPSPFAFVEPGRDLSIVVFEFNNTIRFMVYEHKYPGSLSPVLKASVDYPKR